MIIDLNFSFAQGIFQIDQWRESNYYWEKMTESNIYLKSNSKNLMLVSPINFSPKISMLAILFHLVSNLNFSK
jgi:uncharacterized SAM-dependent methyltransferase